MSHLVPEDEGDGRGSCRYGGRRTPAADDSGGIQRRGAWHADDRRKAWLAGPVAASACRSCRSLDRVPKQACLRKDREAGVVLRVVRRTDPQQVPSGRLNAAQAAKGVQWVALKDELPARWLAPGMPTSPGGRRNSG